MPSLDRLFCSKANEKKPRISLQNVYRVNHRNTLPPNLPRKPHSRRCNASNCRKTAKRGGRCIAHGGGNKCAVDGCTTSVVSRGLCVAHGGGKRCQVLTCAKSAQSGGYCWVHGGGKKCGYYGCLKRAQSGGACIAHGGGKRCRIGECNKVVQYEGLCVGHGGYRRCIYMNCDRRAMANNYCQQHGGSSVCLLKHCYKRAVRGGMCSGHKAETSLSVGGLKALSQSSDDEKEDRQVNRRTYHDCSTTRMHLINCTSTFCSEARASTTDTTPTQETVSSSSLSAPFATSTHEEKPLNRRTDCPLVPGFSALLSANDSVALCTRMQEEYVEPNAYPLLPSIRSLQTYHNTNVLASVSDFYSPTTSDVHLVTTNQAQETLMKWDMQVKDQTIDASMKPDEPTMDRVFMHSYYYAATNGTVPCAIPPSYGRSYGRNYVR